MAYTKKYLSFEEVARALSVNDPLFSSTDTDGVMRLVEDGELDVRLEINNVCLIAQSGVFCTSLDLYKYKKLARKGYQRLIDNGESYYIKVFLKGYKEWRRHIREHSKELCLFTAKKEGGVWPLDESKILDIELGLIGRGIDDSNPIKNNENWKRFTENGERTNNIWVLNVDKPILVHPYRELEPIEGDLSFLDMGNNFKTRVRTKLISDHVTGGYGFFKCLFAGERWYVVKANPFKDNKPILSNNAFMPLVGIRDYFKNLENKKLFITSESLMRFEQQRFGISHGLDITVDVPKAKVVPPYQDKSGNYYAREINIAIEAHNAIFTNGEGNTSQSNTARIETWLRKNYPNESDKFYDRLKTVINPKK